MLTIYKVMVRTNPIDWAEPAQWLDIEFYQSLASAEAKIAEMKADRDWHMNFSGYEIVELEVLP